MMRKTKAGVKMMSRKGDLIREIADTYLQLNELFNLLALEVDEDEPQLDDEEDDSEQERGNE